MGGGKRAIRGGREREREGERRNKKPQTPVRISKAVPLWFCVLFNDYLI